MAVMSSSVGLGSNLFTTNESVMWMGGVRFLVRVQMGWPPSSIIISLANVMGSVKTDAGLRDVVTVGPAWFVWSDPGDRIVEVHGKLDFSTRNLNMVLFGDVCNLSAVVIHTAKFEVVQRVVGSTKLI